MMTLRSIVSTAVMFGLLGIASNASAQPDQIAQIRDMHWVRLAHNTQQALYYSGDNLYRWRGSDGKLYASTNFRTDAIGAAGQPLLIDVDQVLIPCSTDNPESFTVVTSTALKGDWTPTDDATLGADISRSYEVPITRGSAMVGVAHRLCLIIQTAKKPLEQPPLMQPSAAVPPPSQGYETCVSGLDCRIHQQTGGMFKSPAP